MSVPRWLRVATEPWTEGPVIHELVDNNTGIVHAFFPRDRTIQYQLIQADSETNHLFCELYLARFDAINLENLDEDSSELLHMFMEEFRCASIMQPLQGLPLDAHRVLSLRVLRHAALSGIFFAKRYLLAVARTNPNIAYPPNITPRMIADMSCHLFASIGWHNFMYPNDETKQVVGHIISSTLFARYILLCSSGQGSTDWRLMFLAYQRQDSSSNDDDEFLFLRIAENTPNHLWPMSSEYTSLAEHDAAYRKFSMGRDVGLYGSR